MKNWEYFETEYVTGWRHRFDGRELWVNKQNSPADRRKRLLGGIWHYMLTESYSSPELAELYAAVLTRLRLNRYPDMLEHTTAVVSE